MSLLHPLPSSTEGIDSPKQFTNPFCYTPHTLCEIAAKEVIDHCYSTPSMLPHEGKMFGVLVVENDGHRYYLAAFSGIYNGSYHHDGFVPPVYDLQNPDGFFHEEETRIDSITRQINTSTSEEEKNGLKVLRKEKSNALQMWTFRQFRMHNALGDTQDLLEIFRESKSPCTIDEYVAYKEGLTDSKPKSKIGIPPAGAGECCAPKLLQYAYEHHLKPLCMEEFWIGPSRPDDMRIEGRHYPACQHKCVPILTFMLQGLNVEENPNIVRGKALLAQVRTIYEDESIMVISKPSGLLSVPSKDPQEPSLQSHLAGINADYILAHRLDMDTSGLMLVAKGKDIAKQLQAMFYRKEIKKKYIAVLDKAEERESIMGEMAGQHETMGRRQYEQQGDIDLPLSRNPLDAPRQMVNRKYGKSALTHYLYIGQDTVELYPVTGRTHQLRIHCAHPEGLGRPIKGDMLYGRPSDRLYLHATRIEMKHPVTCQWMTFEEAPNWQL